MEEEIANFVAITGCEPQKATQYLQLTDNNLEQAIQLYFDSPNLDFGHDATSQPPPAARPSTNTAANPISVDSDEEMSDFDAGVGLETSTPPVIQPNVEDDEAMARRLQEEMYGDMGGGEAEVRAPMARTTETLVGPGANWGPDEDIDAMVQEQLAARRRAHGRPGIFNQRSGQTSVWDNETADGSARRRELATATGGASESSTKSNMLAEMYRPPFELMFHGNWDKARDEGKDEEKWLLVNVQDPAIFDCQILNRDIWKNADIKETVKENFIFLQFAKDDPRGDQYNNYYFHARDSQDAYPHIAIVDPRTGEQVKVWSGPPVPSPIEFHAELHEFLDRYSLKANAKNPVANRKSDKKKVDVNRMTEDEMLEMALQNSLENNKGPKDEDPDALTKMQDSAAKGKDKAEENVATNGPTNAVADTPFSHISSSNPHTEPPLGPTVTRIQFRGPDGKRVVRRFALTDSVRRIYEWLKAEPWEGSDGKAFEVISAGKNLIDHVDETIEQAGLKMATIMLEFIDEE
ncbi:hypothetical protein EJ04DRAFT_515286 [Polyplosphaeria fusca]|uniref:UBX domain-containing protein n=1 Tax=Polyplosphaeria fusca TaxID=682080 RepID=A0A9P4QN22_9PLEO|nr:hypothetical protein EJ04DRAFT_515286 [Polyplosphaeria fusca]